MAGSPRLLDLALAVPLAALYFVAARVGLRFDSVSGFATLVWPPAGISLAALLLLGYRLWPGIWLGAFLANWSIGAPALVAFGMASGNTLEAIVGAWLLREATGFRPQLDRVSDVIRFGVLAALGSTLIGASLGVLSLWLGGKVAGPQLWTTWSAWWVGDMLGDLVVAPLLLVWAVPRLRDLSVARAIEALALTALVLAASFSVFGDWLKGYELIGPSFPYLLFPVAIWLPMRFGQKGSVTAIVLVSLVAIWGTSQGFGPFTRGALSERLLMLQVFLGILALTGLILAAALAERDALYRQTREALGFRDEFLSIASHELRTPLASLVLQLEALKPEAPAGFEKALEVCDRQAARLTGLVNNLLDVSRIHSGRLRFEPKETRLCKLIEGVAASLSHELRRAGSTLELELEREVVGTWDGARLEQVVFNLMTNAIKYAPGKPIRLSLVKRDGHAVVIVRDAGPGVPKAEQEKIFGRFERGAQTRDRDGLGLGLFIVRQIVQGHRGSIRLESEPGKGAAFIVELPLG